MLIMSVLSFAGCGGSQRLTDEQADAIVARYRITAPVRWYSDQVHPWANEGVIYVDLDWIRKHGLSNCLGQLLTHEQNHIKGYRHCKSRKCIMYFQTGIFGTVPGKMCDSCENPTVLAWIRKRY